jgi:hypothetical protein
LGLLLGLAVLLGLGLELGVTPSPRGAVCVEPARGLRCPHLADRPRRWLAGGGGRALSCTQGLKGFGQVFARAEHGLRHGVIVVGVAEALGCGVEPAPIMPN